MDTKLIRIGNSRGIRIPKALIEAAGLSALLRLRVVDTGLLIERVQDPRAGWEEAARELQASDHAGLLDDPLPAEGDSLGRQHNGWAMAKRSGAMKNTMEIDGYTAIIQFDPDIDMFRGEFVGLKGGGADFHARDVDGLRKEGAVSLKVFLEMCQRP